MPGATAPATTANPTQLAQYRNAANALALDPALAASILADRERDVWRQRHVATDTAEGTQVRIVGGGGGGGVDGCGGCGCVGAAQHHCSGSTRRLQGQGRGYGSQRHWQKHQERTRRRCYY